MYAHPGKADPGTQIAQLTQDVERIRRKESTSHPACTHTSLPLLHPGPASLAQEEFTIEKQLFPESAVFIDGMMARMQKQ